MRWATPGGGGTRRGAHGRPTWWAWQAGPADPRPLDPWENLRAHPLAARPPAGDHGGARLRCAARRLLEHAGRHPERDAERLRVDHGSPAPSQSGAASLAAYYDQKLAWAGCGGAFQCAKLTVPLDYAEAERRDDPDLGDPAAHRRPGQEDRLADPQPRRPRRLGRRLRPRGPRGRRRRGPRPVRRGRLRPARRRALGARRSASTTSRPTPSSPPTARPTTPPRWRRWRSCRSSSPRRARPVRPRSTRTSTPRASRATSTSCALRSATRSSTGWARRTARSSGRRTPTCSRPRSGAWCSTAPSTRR